jgi:hypothetical protein
MAVARSSAGRRISRQTELCEVRLVKPSTDPKRRKPSSQVADQLIGKRTVGRAKGENG